MHTLIQAHTDAYRHTMIHTSISIHIHKDAHTYPTDTNMLYTQAHPDTHSFILEYTDTMIHRHDHTQTKSYTVTRGQTCTGQLGHIEAHIHI